MIFDAAHPPPSYLEDYYLAAQVVADIRKGAAKTHSSKDVRAALDLED